MPVHRWQCADTFAGSHRHWLCGGVWMGCGAQNNSKEQPAYDYECWKNERVMRRYTYTFKRYNDTYTLEWFQTCCFFVFVKCYYLVVPGSSKKTTTHTYMVLWSCSRPPAPQLNVEHTGCTRRPSKKTTVLVTRVFHYHVLQHWVGGCCNSTSCCRCGCFFGRTRYHSNPYTNSITIVLCCVPWLKKLESFKKTPSSSVFVSPSNWGITFKHPESVDGKTPTKHQFIGKLRRRWWLGRSWII